MAENTIQIHDTRETLTTDDRQLLQQAEENLQHAYAPYSNFHVAAALRTVEGNIAVGANQENASYSLCMCGERVALYNCSMQFPGEFIETVAIIAKGQHPLERPAPPCGACLQVLREYELRQHGNPIRLLLKADGESIWEVPTVKTLLPFSFDSSYLH